MTWPDGRKNAGEDDVEYDRCIKCGCDTFEKGHYDMKNRFIIGK